MRVNAKIEGNSLKFLVKLNFYSRRFIITLQMAIPPSQTILQQNFSPIRPAHKPHPKSKFTQEEDNLLRQLVAQFGENNWANLSEHMPHRNMRQCKERWQNYLSPKVCNAPWSNEEDALLEQKYKELGPKWVRIALSFPNRTDTNVKNRWLVLSRRSKKDQQMRNLAQSIQVPGQLAHIHQANKPMTIQPPISFQTIPRTTAKQIPVQTFIQQQPSNQRPFEIVHNLPNVKIEQQPEIKQISTQTQTQPNLKLQVQTQTLFNDMNPPSFITKPINLNTQQPIQANNYVQNVVHDTLPPLRVTTPKIKAQMQLQLQKASGLANMQNVNNIQ